MEAKVGEVYVSKKLLNKNNTVFIKILEENKAYAYHIIKTPLQFNIHYYLVGNLNDLRSNDFEKIENGVWKEIKNYVIVWSQRFILKINPAVILVKMYLEESRVHWEVVQEYQG